MKEKIGFIGTGKMGGAIMRGILKAGLVSPKQVTASDFSAEKAGQLAKELGVEASGSNSETVKKSDIVFLCVKPAVMQDVLLEIREAAKGKLVVSIAAGISLGMIEKSLPESRVIRVMPNTPAMVGESASAFSVGKKAGETDVSAVEKMLSAIGIAVRLDESLMDAATGASASTAFFYEVVGALAEAAEKQGMEKETAVALFSKICLGAGRMSVEAKKSPEELAAQVATPGGATEAGLKELKNSGFRQILGRAFEAAVKRSKELGRK